MEERQVSKSYREALVQISPTTDKKGKKETVGHWREWSVKREGKKRKREVEKEKEKTQIETLFY